MRGRIKKLLMMLLTMTVVVTSMPATLQVQATEINVEELDVSVSDGDLQDEADIMLLTAEVGTEDDAEVVAEVTRAEWLSSLATTFEMTVEDDNYPDNYFSDLNNTSEYYYDILLNVEFGVIDVEEGGEVRPDDPATREFAAHTLNYCLGYQLDESTAATCSDIDDSEYREDLYIAVNRGWFETVDGQFLPEQYITLVEAETMLADASAILASMEVDTDAVNSYDLADDVIVLTKECDEITMDENELVTIVVTDLRETLATGTRFAIYQNTIPTVYVAQTVGVDGSVTTITATIDNSADAYTSVDAEGIVAGSIADIEALDGAEIIFVDEETEEEYESAEEIIALYGANSTKLTNTTVVVKTSVDLGDGLKGQVELKLKNAKITYDVNAFDLSTYAYLECDTELSFKCEAKLDGYSPITDVRLVNWTVPGVGGFVVSADLDLKAAASGVQKGYLKTGVEVSKDDGVRLITGFKAKSFTLAAQGQADLKMTAKLGITDLPVLKAYAYASVGGKAVLTRTEWTDGGLPAICVDFKAYIYAKYGVKGSVKFLGYQTELSIERTIINEKNSPIRCVKHYDDGVEVTECKRDAVTDDGSSGDSSGGTSSTGKKRYVTPANSSWSGSYWGSGTPSAGADNDGNVIPMYSYSINSDGKTVTITGYNGSATSLVIPGTLDGYTVTAIGNSVFAADAKLVSVSIPDSVMSIEKYAFNNCAKLENVELPEKLETMGRMTFGNCDVLECITIPKSLTVGGNKDGFYGKEGAFYGCTGLKNVIFEEGTTEIAEYLFKGCDGLESILIPDTVTKIESGAFQDCTKLQQISFSENITEVNSYCFAGCTSLEKVELPKSLISLGAGAFEDCSLLAEISIPKSLKNVESSYVGGYSILVGSYATGVGPLNNKGAFAGCDNLKTIYFEEGITSIPGYIFAQCKGLEKIEIPDTVTSIGIQAFDKCSNLREIVFGEGLVTIEECAFGNCESLEELELPYSVTNIGNWSFAKCNQLVSVDLPNKLTTIGGGAFCNCENLNTVTIPKTLTKVNAIYLGGYNAGSSLKNGGPFMYCENLENIIFEEGVSCIPYCLFSYCTGLKSVDIPESVIEIAVQAFDSCSNLETIIFRDGLETILSDAFTSCASLKEVLIPNSVTGMGDYVFSGCTTLEKVTLPESRVNIAEGTFKSCTSLKTIELPNSVEYIQAKAFQDSGLTKLVLPENVLEIKQNAFQNCDALTTMTIPNSVATIGNYAFYDCDLLQKVTIPDSVTSLGTYAFQSCDVLNNVSMGLGLTTIPTYTFADCGKLISIVIPYNVTTIKDYAFKNCTTLTDITIPRKTTTISSNAFSYPGKMTVYAVAGSYAETYASEQGMTFVDQSIPAQKVTLPAKTYTVNKGSTMTLTPTITPSNFTDLITWKSSDTSVATVDANGKVKGVAAGTATIKVVVGNASASCNVTVVQPVTSISLNKTSLSMEALETYTLTATAYPTTANNRAVKWSSSDESIATVSASGVVTALTKGSCKITASATDGSGVTKSCTVTVTNNAHVVKNVADLQSSHPYANNCTDVWQYSIAGADGLAVTFDANTYMEDGFDYLYILDGEGNQIGKYTGEELSGKTVTIEGNTVRIQLDTDDASGEYGFKVTSVKSVTPDITYSIVYDKNSSTATGTMSKQSIKYKSGTKLTANKFTRTGYTFSDWNTKADGTGTTYANQADGSKMASKSGSTVTLYAQWKANNYTIKFNGNGATGGSMSNLADRTYDTSYTLTGNAFTRTGYSFKGWNTKADGSGTSYADKASVKNLTATHNGTVTLYAQWKMQDKVAAPTIKKSGNKVVISAVTEGSTIYYTTDSSTPTISNGIKVNGSSVSIDTFAGHVKAIAVKDGYANSSMAKLTLFAPDKNRNVSFGVKGVFGGRNVTFNSDLKGAKIYYSSTTSTLTTSDKCVNVGETVLFEDFYGTIYARTYKDGQWGNVCRLILRIPVVKTPTISIDSKGYATIKTATPSSYLYYTTDGSTPSMTNGKKVSSPYIRVYVGKGKTVKAIAVRSCFTNSGVATKK